MKKRIIAMFLAALLGLYGAGCDDTIEGVEEDVDEGVEEVEEGVDEGAGEVQEEVDVSDGG